MVPLSAASLSHQTWQDWRSADRLMVRLMWRQVCCPDVNRALHALQVVAALTYLHGEMVLHRDLVSDYGQPACRQQLPAGGQLCRVPMRSKRLTAALQKPSNLFLTSSGGVVLGDFGLATRLRSRQVKKYSVCGTPNYIAPEVLDARQGHSFPADVW